MRNAEALAESVVLLLKSALAPVLAAQSSQEARLAAIEPVLGTLRERVAVAEARTPPPGPPGAPGAAGAPGMDGAPGRDGLSLEALLVEQDAEDERLVTLSVKSGAETKTLARLRFPFPRYCGVFANGRRYAKGDQVTQSGGLWHCNAETTERPGESEAWTLQVKRGEAR
jgi:hypothetical protein